MKLKPCPFCGDRAHFAETPEGGHYIECRKCLAATSLMFPEKCEVRGLLAEKWNQRATPPESRDTPPRQTFEAWWASKNYYIDCRYTASAAWDAAVAASGAAGATTAAQEQETARDAILYAFHVECERPTAGQISEWTRRFPKYAEDIRAHAAVARDWAAAAAVADGLGTRGGRKA